MPRFPFISLLFSIVHAPRCASSGSYRLANALLPLMLLAHGGAFAAWPEIVISADSIEYPGLSLQDVRGGLSTAGEVNLEIGWLRPDGWDREFREVAIEGQIREMQALGEGFHLRADVRTGRFGAAVEFREQSGQIDAVLNFERQDLGFLVEIDGVPPEMDWLSQGYVDAELLLNRGPEKAPEVTLQMVIGDLGFDSPDGRFAGAGLQLEANLAFRGGDWFSPDVEGAIQGGELLIDDFYRDFGAGRMEFSLEPEWRDGRLVIDALALHDRHSLSFEGRAALNTESDGGDWELEVNRLELEFPEAYERYLEPVLAPYTLNGLTVAGDLEWNGRWSGGTFQSGDLRLSDLSIVDSQRNRFAFTGLDAKLRPGDHDFDSRLSWRGLLLGRINLGRGEVSLDSEPGRLAIVQPLAFDVMGGRLNLHELLVLLPGISENDSDEPDIRLASVHVMSDD